MLFGTDPRAITRANVIIRCKAYVSDGPVQAYTRIKQRNARCNKFGYVHPLNLPTSCALVPLRHDLTRALEQAPARLRVTPQFAPLAKFHGLSVVISLASSFYCVLKLSCLSGDVHSRVFAV